MKKNIAYNFIFQIFTYLVSFITAPYLSRILGSEGIGICSYGASMLSVFTLFSMLGINKYGTRLCAQNMSDKKMLGSSFWGIYYFQLFMCMAVLALFTVYVFKYSGENRKVFMILIIGAVSPVFDVNWFFNGIEQFRIGIMRSFAVRMITVVLIFIVVRQKTDLWKYMVIMYGGNLFAQVLVWPMIFRYIDFEKPNLQKISKNIKPILKLFIPAVGISIYTLIDKVMIGRMCDMRQLGYYEQAERLVNILMSFVSVIGTVLLSRISFLVKNGRGEESRKIMQKTMFVSVALGSAFACGLAGIADNFIGLYLGSGFINCAVLIRILAVDIISFSWGNVILTQYILPKEKDRSYIITTFLGAAVNFGINVLLLSRMGAVAAAISSSAAQLTVSVYMTVVAGQELPVKNMLRTNLPTIGIGMAMAWIVNRIDRIKEPSWMMLLIQIAAGMFVFVLCMAAYVYSLKKIIHGDDYVQKQK